MKSFDKYKLGNISRAKFIETKAKLDEEIESLKSSDTKNQGGGNKPQKDSRRWIDERNNVKIYSIGRLWS